MQRRGRCCNTQCTKLFENSSVDGALVVLHHMLEWQHLHSNSLGTRYCWRFVAIIVPGFFTAVMITPSVQEIICWQTL